MTEDEGPAYRVVLASRRVQRELDALAAQDYQRVTSALRALEGDPRPRGSSRIQDDVYRMRVGRFRIIYLIDESEGRIVVGAVRRRSETTYRDVQRFF